MTRTGSWASCSRATAPGSYLVLTHVAADIEAEAMAEMARCPQPAAGPEGHHAH